ncbi:MAG TPA: phosphoribulokinase [Gammaproteobacteria bacterium]|nr:phosphoribulokinase [Gammaproteobacteria bacterium]
MNNTVRNKMSLLKLPDSYEITVTDYFVPLVEEIFTAISTKNTSTSEHAPFVLGIQGSQGSGKSTCSEFIKLILEEKHHLNTVILSLDDFYLTRAERQHLAINIHPLLITRGVPGTHDIKLAIDTVQKLIRLPPKQTQTIPRFDKARDERQPPSLWTTVSEPVDVIIIEGWCIGMKPQNHEQLRVPVNILEAQEDADGSWRNYVNDSLAGDYQSLFSMIDELLVLKAPSFNAVFHWRRKQERKLIDTLAKQDMDSKLHTLSDQQLKRFIAHYERLTQHGLTTLDHQARWCLVLDETQQITCLQHPLEAK